MIRFKETGHLKHIYQSKLDKLCFQHDMAYADFADLNRRTEVLSNKAFNIAKDFLKLVKFKWTLLL